MEAVTQQQATKTSPACAEKIPTAAVPGICLAWRRWTGRTAPVAAMIVAFAGTAACNSRVNHTSSTDAQPPTTPSAIKADLEVKAQALSADASFDDIARYLEEAASRQGTISSLGGEDNSCFTSDAVLGRLDGILGGDPARVAALGEKIAPALCASGKQKMATALLSKLVSLDLRLTSSPVGPRVDRARNALVLSWVATGDASTADLIATLSGLSNKVKSVDDAASEIESNEKQLVELATRLKELSSERDGCRRTGVFIIADLGNQNYEAMPLGALYYGGGSRHWVLRTTKTTFTSRGRGNIWIRRAGTVEVETRSGFREEHQVMEECEDERGDVQRELRELRAATVRLRSDSKADRGALASALTQLALKIQKQFPAPASPPPDKNP